MKKKRARNDKGRYEGDDLTTSYTDEAWVATEPKYLYIADQVTKRLAKRIAKLQKITLSGGR
jgi:hypothetical protein|tara:strand:+ start:126 stop:311 length:186 start_codon:yes stop_codon:yes gene_type:complete